MANRKRLFIDIETSLLQGVFFQLGRKVSINHDQITQENQIICICYKWENSPKIYSLDWGKTKNDKKMLQDFVSVVDGADEIVGHNGDRFDLSIIRARCMFHRIPFTPYLKTIDTLKQSRSGFRFNSNRLDYLTKLLLGHGKSETNFQMWKDLTLLSYSETKPTLNKMVKYCKRDVKILQEYFEILNQYTKHKTHYGDKGNCPECNSDRLVNAKLRVSATLGQRVQYQCLDCGKYHTINLPKKK